MYHEDYDKAIDLAIQIHQKQLPQVDITTNNRGLMIYQIQGSAITQAYLSIRSWENGDLNNVFSSKRYIGELLKVMLILPALRDDDRRLASYFNNEIISFPDLDKTKNKKLKEDVIRITKISKEELEKMLKINKKLFFEFSKGPHPNFESIVYNSCRYTGKFNYKCEELRSSPIRNFDFGNFVIVPMLQIVIYGLISSKFDNNDFILMRNCIDSVQKRSIELIK